MFATKFAFYDLFKCVFFVAAKVLVLSGNYSDFCPCKCIRAIQKLPWYSRHCINNRFKIMEG